MFTQQLFEQRTVVDVTMHETVTHIFFNCSQIARIAGIGQLVEIEHWHGFVRQPVEYEVRTNESGAAGD